MSAMSAASNFLHFCLRAFQSTTVATVARSANWLFTVSASRFLPR
jgi:hypothetical protein